MFLKYKDRRLIQGHWALMELNWPCEATQRCAMARDVTTRWHWESSGWLGASSNEGMSCSNEASWSAFTLAAISNLISESNRF